jgi:hypothetical protein
MSDTNKVQRNKRKRMDSDADQENKAKKAKINHENFDVSTNNFAILIYALKNCKSRISFKL